MPAKSYYELLEIAPAASPDEVKRAFRHQIARYHPDKVQHLGREFQDMAAERAAELTEAYRVLSDAGRRGEYDEVRPAESVAPAPPPERQRPSHPAEAPPGPEQSASPSADRQSSGRFKRERAVRDDVVRRATIGRFRQALDVLIGPGYDEPVVGGFDIAIVPRSKLFSRTKNPRLLGRFVSHVDRDAVAGAWTNAGTWSAASREEICVFLMGLSLAPARELAGAIAEQRRKPARGAKVTLIPIDARDWDAHIPTDVPALAKELLTRLRAG